MPLLVRMAQGSYGSEGQLFSLPAENGYVKDLTRTPGAAERTLHGLPREKRSLLETIWRIRIMAITRQRKIQHENIL